jgi:hypothetical protein
MGRGPAFNRCGAGSNPAAITRYFHELEVFVGGMPDSYSARRGFDSLQAHSSIFVGLMCRYIAAAVNRCSEGSSPSPTATHRLIHLESATPL